MGALNKHKLLPLQTVAIICKMHFDYSLSKSLPLLGFTVVLPQLLLSSLQYSHLSEFLQAGRTAQSWTFGAGFHLTGKP